MRLQALRRLFFDYFEKNGHTLVPSSPLIPYNDDTLLFVNAGMVQFKDVFLGRENRPYMRAVSSQRCVRAGGKHNDLENVGYTARHHTFFEMLGNFSFGDYFKKEAIQLAWDFITKELSIPKEKLWVTVYTQDDEAADIWLNDIGVPKDRLSRCGEKDNFWSMGDTGPCGPCTEIFYDHGEDVPGGPPGTPEEDGDRYIEIWNLVFMQYNRAADGSMTPLPKPSVDTGMGLERLAAVVQGVHSNYEVDLFQVLIRDIADIVGCQDLAQQSLRVIADHIRSVAFLMIDGVVPTNEGRGYVLRRIMRRAIRHGFKVGAKEAFFHRCVASLVSEMGEAYPELVEKQSYIEKIILKEERQFEKTLDQGMKILEADLLKLKDKTIPGDVIFKLYDTYGFPMDLTADIARERGLKIDELGFEQEMTSQRERARAGSQFQGDYHQLNHDLGTTDFVGYQDLDYPVCVSAIIRDGELVSSLKAGEQGAVVLDQTPFYAESGGQVGDKGALLANSTVFKVQDTQKAQHAHLHLGVLESGSLQVGDKLQGQVESFSRQQTRLNHSATHLLHAVLRQVLGEHVQQKGSLVSPERLRFDFTHDDSVTPEQLAIIETLVNDQIRLNTTVKTQEMSMKEASKAGAMALFGEKYGDKVRVLSMGDKFSVELCGGTHVNRTGDIGLFKITQESGIAAGVRRIEALTGVGAFRYLSASEQQLNSLCSVLRVDRKAATEKLSQLIAKVKQLEKENEILSVKAASAKGDDLSDQAELIGDIKVLSYKLPQGEPKMLRGLLDTLKSKIGSGVVVLAVANADKVSVIAGVTKDKTSTFSAGELVNFVAQQVGGKGGGRADMAQAGGNQPENLDKALKSVFDWVKDRI